MQLKKLIASRPHLLGHYLGYDKLSEIHSYWILKSWGSNNDYVLQAHRNSYKTTAVLIVGIIWYLLFNPNKTVVVIRKEYDGAASILKAIIRHYQSEKMVSLYKLFGKKDFHVKEFKKDSIVLPTKTRVTKEGSIESIGIGGAVTGRHYDKIIADDIITIKDRISKAERERTKEFIRELENIKNVDGTITFTGTPWHKEDGFSILPEAEKFPIGSIDIEGFSEKKLRNIQERTTASLYAANYLLKHISSEDRVFPDPKFITWDDNIMCRAWLDPAYSGKNTTSLTLLQMQEKKAVIKGWAWRQDVTELYQKLTNICTNNLCGTLYIESNADKGLSAKDMREYYPSIQSINESENKHNKIISYAKQNFPEIYFDYDCQADYLSQIIDYEEGQEPDDAPDGLASLIRQLNPFEDGDSNYTSSEDVSQEYKY